jgi:hypothetical protein
MAVLNNSNAISPSGYNLTNSLRFRGSASPYLSRTFGTPTGTTKGTWSGWVKRGSISSSAVQYVWSAANYEWLAFLTTDKIQIATPGNSGYWETTQVFRDPSAWYHIVVAFDTTLATATDRCKLWINGVQVTAWSAQPTITLNSTFQRWNVNAYTGAIGCFDFNKTAFFDGYIDEINWIDGQALTQSSFGSTNATTGVWQPAKYTGTYGNNGFYLNFSDIALTSGSNAGLGKDFSGNTNYWNTNNISVTTGVTYDAMSDVPTLTSATVANYCTLNPIRYGIYPGDPAPVLSEANLKASWGANPGVLIATMNIPSTGKWYWEAVVPTQTYNFLAIGVVKNQETANLNNALLTPGYAVYAVSGQKWVLNSNSAYMAAISQNTVITVAFDADTGTLYIGAGGSWANGSGSTNQTFSTAASIVTGLTGDISPAFSFNTGNFIANFGQRPFTYTPPTGYKALNTYNLPDSTIVKGNTVMDATTYTGTGASLSVTNTSSFKPDFVWVKGRSGATDHALYDSVRGTTKDLVSNSTAAETTQAQGLTAFGTNGFTVGTLAKMNTSTATYVGWQWQAGQGSTSSNTSGTITSTVSVNATAGFSIATYTGNGSTGATFGHGLGVAPKMVIIKKRSTTGNWITYHTSTGINQYLYLNSTAASATATPTWGVSSTLITLQQSFGDYNTSATTYVAYCWAEIAGFSKFGSYTGNGSADGPFVYLGFRPKWIMIKSTDASQTRGWLILDSSRSPYNTFAYYYPVASSSAAEATSAGYETDLLSNGFKPRGNNDGDNLSAVTYIYMAFAENPFKNALAR